MSEIVYGIESDKGESPMITDRLGHSLRTIALKSHCHYDHDAAAAAITASVCEQGLLTARG